MDLILITASREINGEIEKMEHYVLIKSLLGMLYNTNHDQHKKHICRRCLTTFRSEDKLTQHQPECLAQNGTQAIRMPDDIINF